MVVSANQYHHPWLISPLPYQKAISQHDRQSFYSKLRRHLFQGIKGYSQHPLLPCQFNHLLPVRVFFPLPFRRITKSNSQ